MVAHAERMLEEFEESRYRIEVVGKTGDFHDQLARAAADTGSHLVVFRAYGHNPKRDALDNPAFVV